MLDIYDKLVSSFKAAVASKGWALTQFSEGYNHQEGGEYARFLTDWLQTLSADFVPWIISMTWAQDESTLTCERIIQARDELGFWTLQGREVENPLIATSDREAEKWIQLLAQDVVQMFDRSQTKFKEEFLS